MIRLTLRNLLARKVRLLMSTLAIVLGVAFLSGVLVFSNGLQSTFDSIIQGTAPDGQVRPTGSSAFTAGESGIGTSTIAPDDVAALAALPEVARADGSVDAFGMSLLAKDGSLVGGTGAPTLAFNYTETPNIEGEQILLLTGGAWPDAPGEVLLDDRSAESGDYRIGDEVGLISPFGELERSVTLVGTAEFNGGGMAGATLIVFDTAGAQEVFLDGADAFTSVSLTAASGVTAAAMVDAASAVVPAGFEAVDSDVLVEESQTAIGQFLDIISTFLLVFAVIAVVVGGFIIVNTFAILVAQRSRELALLRALGASRRQVTRSVLLEALVMGVLAATVGILAGWALARGLAALFGAIGLEIAGSALVLDTRAVLISYVVGIGVTLLAAYVPSRRAGRVAPVAAMRTDQPVEAGSLRRRTLIGSGVLLLGAGLAAAGLLGAPGPAAAWVGAGALVWVLTVAVISSAVGKPVLALCRSLFARLFGTSGRLAGENALRDPRRTGATASALMIGLALVSMIGVLATSLNASIDDVVEEEFTSDFLVQGVNFMPFSTAIGDRLEAVDEVALLSRQQWVGSSLGDEQIMVAGNDEAFGEIYDLTVVEGRGRISGSEALITEAEAERQGWSVGDTFELAFPGGTALELTVAGIIEPSELTASVSIPLETLADSGLARQDAVLSVMLEPGADPAAAFDDLKEAIGDIPTVAVYDKAAFSEEIRGQVNQLLYMIYGLLALAIVIAVIGIINTLGLSVIERTREIGLLRAIGMSRGQLRRMITLESVAVAVLGAVLGMALGVLFGVLLREALSKDLTSLGLPLGQLVLFLVVSVVVGVLAAVVPAIRASRLNVLEAISTE
ncbi:ABC transporter permease [Nocardioides sp.]|uniref:ABC transporter permease n=1 Tax=Nocardioides sp. TaxID=35761 RepID=UPI00273288C5|nr:FtsX-like permease family protein [Nocardioides sp.]MDP3892092.1 ABC transporter permease [Nocardioides sp.]